MRRLQGIENSELLYSDKPRLHSRRKKHIDGLRSGSSKSGKHHSGGVGQCAECGGEVKVLVSPRRNPHSSKLGRAVSMKDHDLCRRCWRKLMYQQRREGVIMLPRSTFIGGKKLRPRLLIPTPPSLPREAS